MPVTPEGADQVTRTVRLSRILTERFPGRPGRTYLSERVGLAVVMGAVGVVIVSDVASGTLVVAVAGMVAVTEELLSDLFPE